MFPWGHAAVGYLVYTVYTQARLASRPQPTAVLALGVGTQLPDLIDKPLAWHLDVLASGRSLGHSLLVLGVVLTALSLLARSGPDRTLLVAFAVGSLSHLGADALYPAMDGRFAELTSFFWPVVPPYEYDQPEGIASHLLGAQLTPEFGFEVMLTVLTMALWYRHGLPGVGLFRSLGSRWNN